MKDFNDWYGFFVTLTSAVIMIWLTGYFLSILTKFSAVLIKTVFKQSVARRQRLCSNSMDSEQASIKPGGPPKLAEYALYFFLSRRDRINLIGDLEEEFRHVEAKFGRRPATIWYCKQVVTSIGPASEKCFGSMGVSSMARRMG